MKTRRSLLLGCLAAISWRPYTLAAPASAATVVPPVLTPVLFITTLGNQALDVIRGSFSTQQKMEYFHAMLREDFDLAGAAPFVLGPYWRTATPAERQEFVRLLDDYIVVTFGRRLVGYGGISLRVIGNRGTQSEPIVITEIERPGAAPVKLEWRLSANSGAYRVTDLVLDGVSMSATQHNEFAAMLQRTGGTVAGLLLMMRQIIASGGP